MPLAGFAAALAGKIFVLTPAPSDLVASPTAPGSSWLRADAAIIWLEKELAANTQAIAVAAAIQRRMIPISPFLPFPSWKPA
jgi:hypothetical protein